jgi:hypothetical protein
MATTNSIRQLKLENALDPRLEFLSYSQDKLKWAIFKGANNNNYVQQQANSYSGAGINWSFNTQSEQVAIDRRMYAEVQFKMTFTGTAPVGQPLLNSNHDAPRAYPLASITNSLKATINGSSIEVQYADALQAMLRYNTDFEQTEYDLSGTPTFLDNYQSYGDGVASAQNPLGDYNNSAYQQGRGAFRLDTISNPVSVSSTTPITAIITFTVIEPLLLSPFLYRSEKLDAGLIGVRNMTVQYSFLAGQLERIWSHDASNPGVSITSVLTELGANAGTAPPKLHVLYLTPPVLDTSMVPQNIVYDYIKCDTFVNDQNFTLAPGQSRPFVNNAIQLSIVPKSIYIYACLPNSQKDYTTTDTFFQIQSITLQYLNTSGQLSSAQPFDLYQLSVKNGCKLTWAEWQGETNNLSTAGVVPLCGGVLKIDVEDLAIPDNVSTGMSLASQLAYTITLKNTSASPKAVQLVTVLCYEGLMNISTQDGNMITEIGVINTRDVLETRMSGPWVPYSKKLDLVGGSFWGKLKSFGRDVLEGVKSVLPVARDVYKMVKGSGGAMASGMDEYDMEGCALAGKMGKRMLKSPKKGGALAGGQVLSRREMARMLEEVD